MNRHGRIWYGDINNQKFWSRPPGNSSLRHYCGLWIISLRVIANIHSQTSNGVLRTSLKSVMKLTMLVSVERVASNTAKAANKSKRHEPFPLQYYYHACNLARFQALVILLAVKLRNLLQVAIIEDCRV